MRGVLGVFRELDALVGAIEELEQQRCVDAFGRVCSLCRPRRSLLTAAEYRATMREGVTTGRAVAGLHAA